MSNDEQPALEPCDFTKLLIVDDEEQIRDMFKLFVETDLPDIHVDTAIHGQEAVEKFIDGHHGVILMDLHMPIMDGAEAFTEIEDHCETMDWEVPCIIFCTAYDPPCNANRVLKQYEKAALLRKPVGNAGMIEAVKKALSYK